LKEKTFREIEDSFIYEKYGDSNGFIIENGKNSIVLSAPHSVSQIREGSNKIGEYRTGLIVKKLGKITKSHIIYKTKNLNDDANYDEQCNYKCSLENYIKQENIKLLLDFHISAPDREYDIDIGTAEKNNIHSRTDLLDIIVLILEEKYDCIVIDHTFPASYPHTVASTISRETDIPCFQIEINWKLIENQEKTNNFINIFCKIIERLQEKI